MTVTLILIALMMATFVGWLFRQSINVRPWVAETGHRPRTIPPSVTAPRVGLVVFLAVVTSVFALTVSAYLMRMEMGTDWQPVPVPGLLWVNTAVLVLASLALQVAWSMAGRLEKGMAGRGESGVAGRDGTRRLRGALVLGGGFTLAFLVGQLLVWQRLDAAGYYLAANPANAFFYLLTALHGAHLLGGLVAWGRVLTRLHGGAGVAKLRASVELCALYWHFLLLVWVLLFGLVLRT